MKHLLGPASHQLPDVRPMAAGALVATLGALGAILMASLLATGQWFVAPAAAIAVPAYLLFRRYPFIVLIVWLALMPLVTNTPYPELRKMYWLVHRALPVLALGWMLLDPRFKKRSTDRRRVRLGFVEVAILGYLIVTVVSILYMGSDAFSELYKVYDRTLIPIVLYMLVLAWAPNEREIVALTPILTFTILAQTAIGITSWAAPGVLPEQWLSRVGERTIGSLDLPGTFATTLLFAVLLLVHTSVTRSANAGSNPPKTISLSGPTAVIGFIMVLATLSRASWLAGFFVALGLMALYPKHLRRAYSWLAIVALIVAVSGVVGQQLSVAQDRVNSSSSKESALSRLPQALASARMWRERPVFGFGYGTFEQFDRQFQGEIAGYIPEHDQASHNVYLTVAAEQGTVGLLLYLGPLVGAALVSVRAWSRMPRDGFWSQKFLAVLSLGIASHVIVNNFANVRNAFGLGQYWVNLGLIVLISRLHTSDRPRQTLASSMGDGQ